MRLPYDNSEGAHLLSYLKSAARNGLDITGHGAMASGVREAMSDGVIVLTSAILDADFVVIKVNAGKGLFGRQKSSYMFFVGKFDLDELLPGTTFRSLVVALTSINNIYRSEGLLRGPAL